MRVICISDTHNHHRRLAVPEGDLLIHAGDVSNGKVGQLEDFFDWFTGLPHPWKIFIAGNMDRQLESDPERYRARLPANVFYLETESLQLEGLRIWGCPVVPRFVGAFNFSRGAEIRAFWDLIPSDLDLLITHTPPKGRLDRTSLGLRVGCEDLLRAVQEKPPRVHLFGHVHEAYGRLTEGDTTFVNASIFNGRWSALNPAVSLDL